VFHVTTPAGWAAAQEAGEVVPPSLAAEGFVHCSTESQLEATLKRHFGGHDDLVLLRLRRDRLDDELRWEEGRPGQLFPHLYRPISLSEVAEAVPWHRAGT
jgi:uncharacterized protein (DUF952 family)